ncbi:uncharacterized protein LOC135153465 [Lytechinus pictus]|uniref:uncharacterized protein LOC135153465 n=1 Tax=Lytechinus pictus TaxID=7653 RepID=UPI0030B9F74F
MAHKFLQNFECQIDKKCRRNCCCFEFNFTSPVKYTFPVLLVEAAAAKDDANLHDVASGVLRGLQSLFKEGNDSLFLIRDVTDTAEDMEKEGDASDSPKLIIQGDPFDSAKSQWMVMVESRVIGHLSSTTEGFVGWHTFLPPITTSIWNIQARLQQHWSSFRDVSSE